MGLWAAQKKELLVRSSDRGGDGSLAQLAGLSVIDVSSTIRRAMFSTGNLFWQGMRAEVNKYAMSCSKAKVLNRAS